ncbi:unnamed protein product [Periconia digitata]|uniref:RING-type domain-containing protein n=1 Tax=Periconia digitata TaxID=1303443 RepID=A0A9W4U9C3_9PLEO|nr:unnamed protein product [Periconia digitata]
MTVTKTRGATKKLGLLHEMVKFRAGDRRFAIHKNLIPADSSFILDRHDRKRKSISGECAICHREMDDQLEDITYCRAQCGQNLHAKCATNWVVLKKKCPFCRSDWLDAQEIHLELDEYAVQDYLTWLYGQEQYDLLADEFDVLGDSTVYSFFRPALHLLSVGIIMGDTSFAQATIQVMAEGWEKLQLQEIDKKEFGLIIWHVIDLIYGDDTILRQSKIYFVSQILPVVTEEREEFFDTLLGGDGSLPPSFYHDLSLVLLQKFGGQTRALKPFADFEKLNFNLESSYAEWL